MKEKNNVVIISAPSRKPTLFFIYITTTNWKASIMVKDAKNVIYY